MPRITLKTGSLRELLLLLALEPNVSATIRKMLHWASAPTTAGLRTNTPATMLVESGFLFFLKFFFLLF